MTAESRVAATLVLCGFVLVGWLDYHAIVELMQRVGDALNSTQAGR